VRGTVAGRTVLEQRAVHVVDAQAEADEFPEGAACAGEIGMRTMLSVPLLREGTPLGVILLRRTERGSSLSGRSRCSRPSPTRIAIENVRLFTER
jgi:hypothetical protein